MLFRAIQSNIAAFIGDISVYDRRFALWPYPAVVSGFEHTEFSAHDFRFMMSRIKPGDFILTTQHRAKGSNGAIPGMFKHGMVYLGPVSGELETNGRIRKPVLLPRNYNFKDKEKVSPKFCKHAIIHAESSGVEPWDFEAIYHHYDLVAIVRAWDSIEEAETIRRVSYEENGKKYDFVFLSSQSRSDKDSKNKTAPHEEIYCTELLAVAAKEAGIEAPDSIPKMTRFWRPFTKYNVFIADAFIKAYKTVACTASCDNHPSMNDSLYKEELRQKLLKTPDVYQQRRETDVFLRSNKSNQ